MSKRRPPESLLPVVQPPDEPVTEAGKWGGWWHAGQREGEIICDVCPRECALKPGDRGFCFVRENRDGRMLLSTYGRSTGFCIDPIEKKPLNHFYPGTPVLSFGTAGCNLGCKFCQNWDISKSREVERLSAVALPHQIAAAAADHGCRSVAYTYNDPVIWAEYAMDTAKACRERGIRSVAVTAGYIQPAAREAFFGEMDAANVDLKAFTEEFYYKITYSHLQPVLETLAWLKRETNVWLEITNLVIPDANDSPVEMKQMCDWILEHVGADVPVHFSAFHPDFRLRDRGATPHETLIEAYDVARRAGLRYVYLGNVHDASRQNTYCPDCGTAVIVRDWYDLREYRLVGSRCGQCGAEIPGRFDRDPGDWGRRRLPVDMRPYQQQAVPDSAAVPPDSQPSIGKQPSMNSPLPQSRSVNSARAVAAPCPALSSTQRQDLLHYACRIVEQALGGPRPNVPASLGSIAREAVMGSFVTLKRRGQLRACCGVLGRPMPMLESVVRAAQRTATEDTRLPPLSTTELPYLDVDISLLHSFEEVSGAGTTRSQQIDIGTHGLTVSRDNQSGLLLPSVAVEFDLDAEGFLRQVCAKAGLPTVAWMDEACEVHRFQTEVIQGAYVGASEPPAVAGSEMEASQLVALREWCHQNVMALRQGATPMYYAPGIADGTVQGVVLAAYHGVREAMATFVRLQLRPGLPLQSSLFELAQEVAHWSIQQHETGDPLRLELLVLQDSALHGNTQAFDLRGVDARRRALWLHAGERHAWTYQPAASPEEQVTALREHIARQGPASVLSFAASCTADELVALRTPRASGSVSSDRPAAVAGQFYPADPDALAEQVRTCLQADNAVRDRWPAAMVPHAGYVYSGRVAGQVLQRLTIPDTVIVIGPKHTRSGVPWAVAPHQRWLFPGGSVENDRELGERLVKRIAGLEWDAAAHEQEHGIEVQLPFLASLNPRVKVVGITIGGGDYQQCDQFAQGLADVLSSLPAQPLLLISSDMNHFANDEETRRLDQLALEAMLSRDAASLLRTCQQHRISMCGVLPAVIVMRCLQRMDQLQQVVQVAYATSADASGDTSRVVGYAGALLGP